MTLAKMARLAALAVVMAGPVVPAAARDLVVGVEAIDYSPVYGYRDGQFTGAGRAILDAYAKANGHGLTYKAFPVKRLLAELVHGGIDLKFPDSPDWQAAIRQGYSITYSAPVIAYIDGTLVRQDMVGARPDGIRSLGIVSGFTPYAWQSAIQAGRVEVKENPGFEPVLRQVQIGRLDAVYANVAVALAAAEVALGPTHSLVYAPNLPHVADSYRLSSGNSPEIIAEFNDWLAKNGKQVAEILAKTGAEKGVR
jgi:ABC-type amino acid transport substrate-binding protein